MNRYTINNLISAAELPGRELPGGEQPDEAPLPDEHRRVERAGRLHWFHWLIVGASAFLTVIAWYLVQSQVDERIGNQFERESRQVLELVSERMVKYEDALWGGVAAIHSQSQGIDYKEWKRFSDTLKLDTKYPGINGIGVIYRFSPKDLDGYLAKEREGRPDFKIHPAHDQDEYFPITYIEPVQTNAAAVGLDMAHETNRYTAAKKARDTGVAQITGPITLVQDAAKTPGFLFFAPFYEGGFYDSEEDRQRNFVGMVYAPFIFKKLMQGALDKEKRHIGIKILDGEDVLYDENLYAEIDFDPDPQFRKTASVEMYGRTWKFELLSTLSFRQATSNDRPWLILVGGGVIDTLLLGLFITMARSNRRAVRFAQKMTRQYQAKTNLLSNVIEHAVDGLITIDENGLIESFNPACERIFGYGADAVLGENITLLVPDPYHVPDDADPEIRQDAEIKEITGVARKVEGRRKDGTAVPLEFSVSEIIVDGRTLYNGIIRDITERTQAEEEIMRSNLELERFAYIASHDLQEPLRMVSSFTELLDAEYGGQMDEQAQQYMEYMLSGSKRMQGLIADLLEYSRVDSEESGFFAFDGRAEIDAVLVNLHESIEETATDITVGEIPEIYANPVRFARLMQNLIGNAIKYRAPDRRTKIHIGAEDRATEWLFFVRDNGIGIKADYLDQVFVIFKRLHNNNKYSGTGIGLAICAKIVENFGGKIWVESEPDEGSVFYFTLPKPSQVRNAA